MLTCKHSIQHQHCHCGHVKMQTTVCSSALQSCENVDMSSFHAEDEEESNRLKTIFPNSWIRCLPCGPFFSLFYRCVRVRMCVSRNNVNWVGWVHSVGDSLSTISSSLGGTCMLIQYCRRLAAPLFSLSRSRSDLEWQGSH